MGCLGVSSLVPFCETAEICSLLAIFPYVSAIDHIRWQDKFKFWTVKSRMFLHELPIALQVRSSVWLVTRTFLPIIANWAPRKDEVEFVNQTVWDGPSDRLRHWWIIIFLTQIAMGTWAIRLSGDLPFPDTASKAWLPELLETLEKCEAPWSNLIWSLTSSDSTEDMWGHE